MAQGKSTSPDDLLSTPEVGVELGIGVARVNVLINEGRLPAIRIGKVWAIRRADLDLVRNRPPGRPRTKPDAKPQPAPQKPKPRRS